MKILLTGATGFIGRHLFKALKDENHEVVILARSSSETSFTSEDKILISDQDFETLRVEFSSIGFDGVIHLASLYVNQHKPDDIKDLIQSNIFLGTQILEMAKENNVSWFVNTGTLFQHFNNEKYNPVNLYAATKQAFEDVAKYYYETSGLNFVTLKLNDTYGPADTRKKIFNLWMECANSGRELHMSPGEQKMELIYIDDVVNGYMTLVKLLENDTNRSYCGKSFSLPSKERMSLKKLAFIFEEVTGKSLDIKWGKLNYRPREVMEPANIIEALPGWKQKVLFKEGLGRLIGDT
ncbi:NAD-dependent epimerase/dehydratase family protein [Rhodohalobacter halophilus]|uniref:NAD-dependent epimerase/dehydratase family protein n=1 Tax=Rhodohalobacter halophilus TaxID=1812810 RepID=UPI00083FCE9F|nr:NAD(P)-dependent oxidoreductase [Rhodohalobacter halophilus]